jgi:hypothetical protein
MMLDYTKMLLQSDEISLKEKIDLLRTPIIYTAENIADYLDNTPNICFPWYRGFPALDLIFGGEYISSASIYLHDVKIELVESIPKDNVSTFLLHDDTGSMAILWGHKDFWYFGPEKTFEETQQEQGLEAKDWVYRVFFAHVKGKCPVRFIGHVKKDKFTRRKKNEEKESLMEKIRRLLQSPESELLPELKY